MDKLDLVNQRVGEVREVVNRVEEKVDHLGERLTRVEERTTLRATIVGGVMGFIGSLFGKWG